VGVVGAVVVVVGRAVVVVVGRAVVVVVGRGAVVVGFFSTGAAVVGVVAGTAGRVVEGSVGTENWEPSGAVVVVARSVVVVRSGTRVGRAGLWSGMSR
jgi:hypothetical protein